jgi:hypothetical protein
MTTNLFLSNVTLGFVSARPTGFLAWSNLGVAISQGVHDGDVLLTNIHVNGEHRQYYCKILEPKRIIMQHIVI